MSQRPPLPPFTLETARQKVLAAEAAWNTRDPDRVVLAYTEDTVWRNRSEFLTGRDEVYGNENWEFDAGGLMHRREASINDVEIAASERRIDGPRADGDTSGIPLQ
jgi:uncharacterized protein